MAKIIHISGKASLQIQLVDGTGSILELGEAQDATDIEQRNFLHNVPGDVHGGPQGPPIDIQNLGMIFGVTVEMSKWDATTVDLLRQRQEYATLGTIAEAEIGSLLLGSNSFRLLVNTPTRPYNFPTAIIREPIREAKSTRYTAMFINFECHRTPSGTRIGVLYNSDVTATYS